MSKGQEFDAMSFLNEVKSNYPRAISMASGRPDSNYFMLKDQLVPFIHSLGNSDPSSANNFESELGQYHSARGTILQELVMYYKKDFDIELKMNQIMVTSGAQEAFALAVQVFCQENHVVAYEDPSYIGLSTFAKLAKCTALPIKMDKESTICLDSLEANLKTQRSTGKPIRLLYVIPDFQNPTGAVMSLTKRTKILQLAQEYDFYILEDNAYGFFRYDGVSLPTLLQLDKSGRVLYVESFSKTVFPSIRLAAVILKVSDFASKGVNYLEEMIRLKGYVTLNTSAINQLILKSILLQNEYSIQEFVKEKRLAYSKKRDCLIRELRKKTFEIGFSLEWVKPQGGFFIMIKTPFCLSNNDVIMAAEDFGIVFCLYSFFTTSNTKTPYIRLSFSDLTLDDIAIGVDRLINFLTFKHDIIYGRPNL